MIEIRFKYLNKIKFEKYINELLIKHSVDTNKMKIEPENCKLLIEAKEEDIKELLKDRLVSMWKISKRK
jgi:hypothetical protein